MTATQAAALAGVMLLGAMSPGPDFALVLRNTLTGGRLSGLACAAGVGIGVLGWALAAALGVAGMLAASATAFAIVKFAGAAYLIVLGLRALISAVRRGSGPSGGPAELASPRVEVPLRTAFTQGLLTNLLNPKAAVFFVALMPQFLPTDVTVARVLELCLITTSVTTGWFSLLAVAVAAIGHVLTRPRVRRTVDTATGTLLIGLGLRVATSP